MAHNIRYSRSRCLLLAFALATAAVCILFPTPQERMARDHIAQARAAHSLAQADPVMQAEDLPGLIDAEHTLNAAAQARDVDEKHHLAYMGQRQTQIAVSLAHVRRSRQEGDELRRENNRLRERAGARNNEGT